MDGFSINILIFLLKNTQGVVTFEKIRLFLEPFEKIDNYSIVNFLVNLSSVISSPIILNSDYQKIINGSLFFYISMILGNCMNGETYNTILGTCTECKLGTYSFNSIDKSCKVCPKEAFFCIQNLSELKPGFWRSEKTSKILPCEPLSFSCL